MSSANKKTGPVFYTPEETAAYAARLADLFRKAQDAKPQTMLSCLDATDLADFTTQCCAAGEVARRHGKLYNLAAIRADRPYQHFLVDCNPWIHGCLEGDGGARFPVPVDWLDISVTPRVSCPDPMWRNRGHDRPSAILLPSQLGGAFGRAALRHPERHAFRLPPEMAESLDRDLIALGLPAGGWHACLFLSGEPADAAAEAVEAAGGRLVLLEGPDVAGAVDLRHAPFELRTAAMAGARFVLGNDPGLLALAACFRVPSLERADPLALRNILDETSGRTTRRAPPPLPPNPSPAWHLPFPLERKDRPAIVAFLGHQTIGDLIHMNMTAAAVAQAFPDRELLIVYREDRPYKGFLARLNPLATAFLAVPNAPRSIIPFDWFLGFKEDGRPALAENLRRRGFDRPDIFLGPSMLNNDAGTLLDPVPTFRIPEPLVAPYTAALVARGLDPERWFVVLHAREGGYAFRASQADDSRNADIASYLPMVEDIVLRLGGQVVRIGDPSMPPLPRRPGLIDLAPEPDSFQLQVFAVSRARYLISGDSGPILMGAMFGTPTAKTNSTHKGVQGQDDIVVPKWVVGPDGRRHDPRLLERLGAFHQRFAGLLDGHRLKDNDPEDLIEASRLLHTRTEGLSGWRAPQPAPPPPGSGGVLLPPRVDFNLRREVWTRFPPSGTNP